MRISSPRRPLASSLAALSTSAAVTASLLLAVASPAKAQQTLYWDPGQTPALPVGGGSGIWDTASSIWSDGSVDGLWQNSGLALFYGAASNTVTINNGGAGITASGLSFLAGNFTIASSGTAGDILTLTGPGTVQVADSASATISTAIAGAAGLNFNGNNTGTLVLTGANSFTGGVTVTGGILDINNATALGAAANTFTIGGGSTPITIDNTSGAAITTSNYAMKWNADFSFGGTNALNLGTGAVTLGSSRVLTVSGTGALTVGGIISGSGFSLTKAGNGTLVLNGANTFNGGTTISAGTIKIGNATALGTGTVTIQSGGQLDVNGQSLGTQLVHVSGSGPTGAGAIINTGISQINALGKLVLDGDTKFGGAVRFDLRAGTPTMDMGGYTLSIATGDLNGNYFSLVGATINNPGNISVVSGGKLSVETTTNLGGSAANLMTVNAGSILSLYQNTVAQQWTLDLEGGTVITASGSGTNNTWSGPVTVNAASTFNVPQVMTLNGVISGSGALTKTGAGNVTISGSASNTFTGSMTVTGGNLILAKTNGANGTNTAVALSGNTVYVTGGANGNIYYGSNTAVTTDHSYDNEINTSTVLDFTNAISHQFVELLGNDQTLGGLVAPNQNAVFENQETQGGTAVLSTLTLNVTGSNSYTYAGYLRDHNTSGGTGGLALVKNGSGTETLSGSQIVYTGTTTINSGTLVLNGATAFASPVTFGSSSNGILQIASATQSISGLSTADFIDNNAIVQNTAGTDSTLTINQATNTAFGGIFQSNAGGNVLNINKVGAGTLTLTNNNSGATGTTTVSAGTLIIGAASNLLGGNVILNGGTLSLLSDTNTTFTNIFTMNNAVSTLNIDQAIGGSGTNGVVTIGSIVRPTTAPAAGTLNITGGHGYSLVVGSVALPGSTGHDTIFIPSVNMTITGNVTNQMSGFGAGNFDTLYLQGTSTGNSILGTISDSPTGTSVGGYTRVIKADPGTWTLNGANSPYTGLTTIRSGTLRIGAANAVGVVGVVGVGLDIAGTGTTAILDLNHNSQTIGSLNFYGTTSNSTANSASINNVATLTLNGNVTYYSTGNPQEAFINGGTIDFNGGARTWTINDSTTAAIDTQVSSVITNGALIKAGAGVLSLTANNTYAGGTTINAGTLAIGPSGSLLSGSAVILGGGTLDLGGTTENLNISGFGTIQNGTITVGGTGAFLKNGTGTLTLAVPVATSSVTINQGLASAASSPAAVSALALNFAGAGAPTTFFASSNPLTLGGVATSLVGGGGLILNGAASASNVQSFATTLLGGGASSVSLTGGSGGSVALNLGTLTRNTAGTIDFVLPTGTVSSSNGVTIANPGAGGTLMADANGTAYATVGGNDWAAYSTDLSGNIVSASVAGAGGTSLYTAVNNSGSFLGNADITGSFTTASNSTVNSLRFNTGSLTLTLSGTTTISTGGVLFGSGITAATITGGSIVPGPGGELVFISNKAGVVTAINSIIADGSSGASSVTYRGNIAGATSGAVFQIGANNTYTGPTYITQGRVQITTGGITSPFGTGSNAIVYIDGNADGQFFDSQNVTISNPFVIIGTGYNEGGTRRGVIRLDSSSTNTPNLSGSITLLGDSSIGNNAAATAGAAVISGNIGTSTAGGGTSFALSKVMTGTIKLTGTNSQTATIVNAGVLNVNADAALGLLGATPDTTAPLTLNGGALQFQNAFVLSANRNVILGASGGSIDTQTLTSNTEIAGVISGTGGLTKTYTPGGTQIANSPLILSGVNTFTGAVTDTFGSLIITNSASLGTGTKTVTITNGTAGNPQLHLDPSLGSTPGVGIDLASGISFTVSNTSTAAMAPTSGTIVNDSGNNIIRGTITITSGGGGLVLTSNSGSLTLMGNITTNTTGRAVFLRGNAVGAISGNIVDGSTPQMPVTFDQGGGTWTLSGNNTYGGATSIQSGTLKVGSSTALGFGGAITTATGTTVSSNATLDLNGTAGINEVINVAGTGNGGIGALINNTAGTTAVLSDGVATATISGATGASSSTVTVSGGGGTGAKATANLGVTTSTFAITGGTTVYSVAPTVTISGGGGSGATATAVLTNGVVTGITITAAGTGFTGAPTIAFSGGTVTTTGTNPTGTGNATNFLVNSVTITSAGSGYTSAPTFTDGTTTITPQLSSVNLTGDTSIGGAGDIVVNGAISGSTFGLNKIGTGTVTLVSANNSYSGNTNVTAGTLLVNGSIASSPLTSVTGPGTIAGTGTVGALLVSNGGVVSPGNGIGRLSAATTLFQPGGVLKLELGNDGSSGTAGTNWDQLAVSGFLDNGTLDSNDQFVLKLQTIASGSTPGALGVFDPNVNHLWSAVVTTTSGFTTSFNSNQFVIDTSSFANGFNGTFSLVQNNNSLDLQYLAVPEPGTIVSLLGGIGMLTGLQRFRRRR